MLRLIYAFLTMRLSWIKKKGKYSAVSAFRYFGCNLKKYNSLLALSKKNLRNVL